MTTSAITSPGPRNRNRAVLQHRGQLQSDGWHLLRRTDPTVAVAALRAHYAGFTHA